MSLHCSQFREDLPLAACQNSDSWACCIGSCFFSLIYCQLVTTPPTPAFTPIIYTLYSYCWKVVSPEHMPLSFSLSRLFSSLLIGTQRMMYLSTMSTNATSSETSVIPPSSMLCTLPQLSPHYSCLSITFSVPELFEGRNCAFIPLL